MSRRFRRRPPGSLLLVGGAALLVLGRFSYDRFHEVPRLAQPAAGSLHQLQAGLCQVRQVVDASTVLVEWEGLPGRPQRVRLLGILPPDQPHLCGEAEQLARSLIANAGQANLELDKRRMDRHGELLAYIYVDNRSLGTELVRAGLAIPENYPGDNQAISRELYQAEREARRSGHGMWKETRDKGTIARSTSRTDN